MRGATEARGAKILPLPISIHAPHAGSDNEMCAMLDADEISIHAPHAGSDVGGYVITIVGAVISIHAPHAGSDSGRAYQG